MTAGPNAQASKVVVLAGGVGGARMAAGLQDVLAGAGLTVIVNTADDFEHLGLSISPDLDTVMYTLAGLENTAQGWGLRDETWSFMAALAKLGGETWFQLGDRDLATHIERTRRLAAREALDEITASLARALGVRAVIVPMTNQQVRSMVETGEGPLSFQRYFVERRCEPQFLSVRFEGSEAASATPSALAALADPGLEAIILAPSNPYVSVAPLMAIAEIEAALERRHVPLIAVSPIVGGRAIKGPAAKMLQELGKEVSALGIARHYAGLIDGLVIDAADLNLVSSIEALGLAVHVTDTIMRDGPSRRRLAEATLDFARRLRSTDAVARPFLPSEPSGHR